MTEVAGVFLAWPGALLTQGSRGLLAGATSAVRAADATCGRITGILNAGTHVG